MVTQISRETDTAGAILPPSPPHYISYIYTHFLPPFCFHRDNTSFSPFFLRFLVEPRWLAPAINSNTLSLLVVGYEVELPRILWFKFVP